MEQVIGDRDAADYVKDVHDTVRPVTWTRLRLHLSAPGRSERSETGIREFVQIDAAFRGTIQLSDPRYANLAHLLAEISTVLFTDQRPGPLCAILRSKLKAVRRVANFASDSAQATVRHWRNLLLIGGSVLASARSR